MEKQSKLKIQILKFLSQAAAPAVTYKSPPPSPRHPMVSIIPRESRRKKRNEDPSFATREPTSPKVSCMGQVKGKHKKKKTNKIKPKAKQVCPPPMQEERKTLAYVHKEKTLRVLDVITPKVVCRTSPDIEGAPSLGQMKRFESRRGALSDFDLAEVDEESHRLESLKIRVGGEEEKEEENDEDEKNKKEVIVLWKRRSVSPPPIPLSGVKY